MSIPEEPEELRERLPELNDRRRTVRSGAEAGFAAPAGGLPRPGGSSRP
jgi:hypothetical protein